MYRLRVTAFLLLTILGSSFAWAVDEGEIFSRGAFVPMTVLSNGRKSGTDLVVNYSVRYSRGAWTASLEAVKILGDRMSKRTILLPAVWSSAGGDIKNVVVGDNAASFDLVMESGDAVVVAAKGDRLPGEPVDVRVRKLSFNAASRKPVLEEWLPTDRIVLRYKEVYGSLVGSGGGRGAPKQNGGGP